MKLIADKKSIDSSSIHYLLTQGEKNADIIEFEIDRVYLDYSVENCTFIIKAVNSNGNQIEKILHKTINETTVILKWEVDEDFTAAAGEMELEIRGVINVQNEEILVIKYTMQPIEIKSSSDGNGLPEISIINQAINTLQINVQNGIESIQTFVNQQIADSGYPYIITTQSAYDVLSSVDASKLYVITGD